MLILMLKILLKQKKPNTAAVLKTPSFYSGDDTSSSTSFVYYVQLYCKLLKAQLFNSVLLLRCQFTFNLLRK